LRSALGRARCRCCDRAVTSGAASNGLSPWPREHRAIPYLDAGDLVAAKQWADQSLAKQPRNLDALLAAGTVQLGAEENEKAATTFSAALEINAASGRAWAGSALAKLLKLDLAGGRADFE
jgi:tetratricopeptide (TPR) repeat protein